jgi:hypothetical protein
MQGTGSQKSKNCHTFYFSISYFLNILENTYLMMFHVPFFCTADAVVAEILTVCFVYIESMLCLRLVNFCLNILLHLLSSQVLSLDAGSPILKIAIVVQDPAGKFDASPSTKPATDVENDTSSIYYEDCHVQRQETLDLPYLTLLCDNWKK